MAKTTSFAKMHKTVNSKHRHLGALVPARQPIRKLALGRCNTFVNNIPGSSGLLRRRGTETTSSSRQWRLLPPHPHRLYPLHSTTTKAHWHICPSLLRSHSLSTRTHTHTHTGASPGWLCNSAKTTEAEERLRPFRKDDDVGARRMPSSRSRLWVPTKTMMLLYTWCAIRERLAPV